MELHFQEIPNPELEVILHKRCEIPLSYAKKMIAVLTDLQVCHCCFECCCMFTRIYNCSCNVG